MKRAVLLDALGTLLELEPPAPRLVRELAARGVHVTEEEAWAALRAEIAYYRAHHDIAGDREGLAELRRRCTEVLRDALPAHAREAGDLQTALLAALRFRPFDDVAPALAELRARGARLVVVSNWDVSLHDALSDTGLAALVDGAISSAAAGAAKPDPRIFERALALPLSYPADGQPLMSLPRFLAVLWPLHLWLALVLVRRRVARAVIVGVLLVTLAVVSWTVARWGWVA